MHKGDKIRKGSFQEHVINKSMWKGAAQPTKIKSWILADDKFMSQELYYSPAGLKIYDELVVNFCDHWWDTRDDKYPVTSAHILFDKKSGHLTVYNNGSGFPVRKMKDGVWLPQAVCSQEFTGSNLDVDDDRRTGGTNGLGMKIASILSREFIIETVDPYSEKYYYQEFYDNISRVEPPQICSINDPSLSKTERKPHTQIDLEPDYVKLGYNKYNEKVGEHLEHEMVLRLYQIATFINTMGGKCTIKYNNQEIKADLKKFASMFPIEDIVLIDMPHPKFPWKLAIGTKPTAKFESHSVINGVYARDGGNHINHLSREIYRGLSGKVEKILRDFGIEPNPDKKKHDLDLQHYVMDRVFLFMFGQIGDPQWTGQSKEKLTMKPSLLKDRVITDKDLNKIWKIVKPFIELSIAERRGNKKRPKGKVVLKKYKKAKNAGKGNLRNKCYLFIPEGDSAQLLIEKMFAVKNSKISSNYYGIYNIGGVPVNVRKKIRYVTAGGKSVRIISDKLDENDKFQGLMDVIGLDYDKTYEIDADFNKLKYQHIIIAVDQDHDGVGQINGLLVNMFATLWPELIRRGFILRWESPIMRAFSKKKMGKSKRVLDFYSETQYNEWLESTKGASTDWYVKYYKGLSAHQPAEAVQLARTFDNHLIEQLWDDTANKSFEIFYGQDTDERKRELCTPVINPVREEITKTIDCTYLLQYHVKMFQLSVIDRKVPNVHDGLASVHRKVLAGARTVPTKTMKVFQLGGLIAQKMNYHHGDTSINKAISYMCQCFMGAKNMPLLQGLGQFGSIEEGTRKFGSPRYNNVRLNKRLTDILFPPVDDWLLPYVFEDGIRCEPNYYSPIVPYAILEHFTSTSVGWKICIYARDFAKVVENVRRMIRDEEPTSLENSLWTPDKYDAEGNLVPNQMDIREALATNTSNHVTPHCFGKYKYIRKKNIINITELPIRKWVKPYVDYISEHKEKYVDKVESTLGERPNINIKLKPGVFNTICQEYGNDTMDPIEQCFELRQNLAPSLNFVDEEGKVLMCTNYVEAMKKWFPMRRDLYKLRLRKDIIMCELMILYYQNLIRYWKDIDDGTIIVPKSADVDILCNQLIEGSYNQFDKARLMKPKYTPVDKLRDVILGSDASYDYILDGCTPRTMTKAAQAKRNEELVKLQEELSRLKSLTWKTIWENDLKKLEDIVAEGTDTSWLFGEGDLKWQS